MRTNTSSRCHRRFDQLRRATRRRLISPANSGPKRFHQNLTVSWQTSMPRSTSQIFDLSQRQRVADIHHHREPDDLWRTVEIAEGVLHLVKLWMPHLHINPFLSDNTQPTLPREYRRRNSSRRLLWAPHRHHRKEKKDQKTDHPKPSLEPSIPSGLTSNKDEPDPPL